MQIFNIAIKKYMDNWYNFDDSIYKKMSILYDDYCLLREVREVVASKTKRVDLRWVRFFWKM